MTLECYFCETFKDSKSIKKIKTHKLIYQICLGCIQFITEKYLTDFLTENTLFLEELKQKNIAISQELVQ